MDSICKSTKTNVRINSLVVIKISNPDSNWHKPLQSSNFKIPPKLQIVNKEIANSFLGVPLGILGSGFRHGIHKATTPKASA
jgi:hypothetical protein